MPRGPGIGTFSITIEVGDPRSERYKAVEALVDTRATHTMLPREVTETLGIAAVERLEFRLADQSIESYDVGEARVRLDGRERTVPVVFGPEGAGALLGATTLEIFHLTADPVAQRLLPTLGLLMRRSAYLCPEPLLGCATLLRCGVLACATLLRCGVLGCATLLRCGVLACATLLRCGVLACATLLRCGVLACATLLRCGVTTWVDTRHWVGGIGI